MNKPTPPTISIAILEIHISFLSSLIPLFIYGVKISFVNIVAVPIIFPEALLIVAATIAAKTIPATIGGANVIVA